MISVRHIATAFMFLTRLPVGRWASGEASILSAAVVWFPLVGIVIGLLVTLVGWVVASFLPLELVAIFMLLGSVMLTGAFHEDGLADVADSAGAFGRENKLDIMRDSRIGTYGGVALIILCLFKWQSFTLILQHSGSWFSIAATLVLAHSAARWSSLWLMHRHPYARAEAPNKVVAATMTPARLWQGSWVFAVAVVVGLAAYQLAVILVFLCVLLVAELFGRYCLSAFGGITGDCLGAANQLVECTVLLVCIALLT